MPRLERAHDDQGGSQWLQGADSFGNHEVNYMGDLTEREIADDAFDRGEDYDSLSEHEENDELVDEQSQVQGWDGDALSDEDQWAYDGGLDDRPTTTDALEDAHERIAQMEEELENERQLNGELLGGGMSSGAQRERDARWAQARESLKAAGMYDEQHINNILGQAENADIEMSMQRMAAQDRDAFHEAYSALTSTMDPQNPRDRAAVQQILYSRDPGRGIMQWYAQQQQNTRGNRVERIARANPRSLSREVAAYPQHRGPRDLMDERSGDGNRDDEQDIFKSAFADAE